MDAPLPDPVRTLEQLTAEVARLRCWIEQQGGTLPAAEPIAVRSAAGPLAAAVNEPIDRRSALRRAGLMAAGAVTGGAAIVAATASPAAAATVTGSGNPGVSGSSTGGDGVAGTTSASSFSGVYGSTATAGAYGVFARNTGGGTALGVAGASDSGPAVAKVTSTGAATALDVRSGGTAVSVTGGDNLTSTPMTIFNLGGVGALDIQTAGSGVSVAGTAVKDGSEGFRAQTQAIGFVTASCGVAMRIQPNGSPPPPQRGSFHQAGMIDYDGADLWICVENGSPGVWRRLGGTSTAGALTVLPTPARIYDSRPSYLPNVGPKTPLPAGGTRTLDLKVNSSGVPAGATAALLTVLLVNAASGNGNATVWANGVNKPQANTLVWGGSTGRFTATAVSALDTQARIQVSASMSTDIVIDVVGYYR